MIKFEVGKKYYCTSVCYSSCRWEYTIIKRTDKSIWMSESDYPDNIKRFGIKEYENLELVYPMGKYSMCPILKAERVVV